jgi:hypothetical protein
MKCQVLHWFQPTDVQKNINMNTSRKKNFWKDFNLWKKCVNVFWEDKNIV